MKRYKRGIICLPDCYSRQRVEMNIYKELKEIAYKTETFIEENVGINNEQYDTVTNETPIFEMAYFINWEGEWQEIIYRKEYGEWEFKKCNN